MPNSAIATAPAVLIAANDPWDAELLSQLVQNLRPNMAVHIFNDAAAALKRCQQRMPELLILDDDLAPSTGSNLLRQLRRLPNGNSLVCVLLSSRIDSNSVRAIRPLAPAAYLAKPFNAEHLRQRLDSLLPQDANAPVKTDNLPESLALYLDKARENALGAPVLVSVQNAVSSRLNANAKDLGTLAEEFQHDPQITARLIAAANSAAEQQGEPCQTLPHALQRLGVLRSLNLVLGLTLQQSATLSDPRLDALAQIAGKEALRSAELAHWIAKYLRLEPELCYTAALLHNIGDLALLRSLQDWQLAGGTLEDDEIEPAIRQRSAAFGSALRTRWRLPLDLRELITAYYSLSGGVFSREALVLNLCAQLIRQNAPDFDAILASRTASMLRIDPNLLRQIPERMLKA